jgi:pimeloyl-ACP methyl ester carboxylesterase
VVTDDANDDREAPTTGRLHLDSVTGVLARVAQLVRPRVRDTLDDLHVYEGRSLDELFPAPRGLPAVRWAPRWRVPGLVSEQLAFPSQHDPLEPKFRRHYHARRRRIHTVTARRIRPGGSRERPRLLYIHGYMQPETLVEELTLLVGMSRALDMEIVQLQPPYHGTRKPRSSRFDGELFWTADLVRSFEALRQTVLDARTLLAWLRAESDTPVGVCGLSLGGSLAEVLTCVEPDFAFSAPFIAHMDVGALAVDAPVLGAMRDDLRQFGWEPEEVGDWMDRVGWRRLRPVIAPERIHLFAGREDLFFDPRLVEALWRDWGEPEIVWYPCSHMGFLPYLPDALARLRRFVDERVVGAPALAGA